MTMTTFHIKTYGCQMNARDSESVHALLVRHGMRPAAEADADVIVVNTCSVREKAEDKALGKLGLMVATKRERPGRLVGAMGCMVQRLGSALFARVRGLDFAVGTRRLARLPGIVDRVRSGGGPVLDIESEDVDVETLSGHAEGAVTACVNILFGCDRRCSYCIVPDVRGREWSRPAASIVAEVASLAEAGVKDVTLLGQSVMMYGRRNAVWAPEARSPGGYVEALPRLLEAVAATPGLRRIRFTSGHPSGCTPELARAMAAIPEVCHHIHIPVQSGSDRILRAMRRGYTAGEYREAVRQLRGVVPDLAVTTDVIVGFPGETAADFEATRELLDEVGVDQTFVFKYSPRPGTPAAALADDVGDDEKLRRNHVLLADQDGRGQAINDRLIGRAVSVLVEGRSLRNDARWSGRTGTNKIVIFDPAPGVVVGAEVPVAIDRAMPQTLYGQVVRETRTAGEGEA